MSYQNPPFKGPETLVPSEMRKQEQLEDLKAQLDSDESAVITLRIPRWMRNYINKGRPNRDKMSMQKYCFNILFDKFKEDFKEDKGFMDRLKIYLSAQEKLEQDKILRRSVKR